MHLERLVDLLFSSPQRWMDWGRAVVFVSLGVLFLGLVARVALQGAAVVGSLAVGLNAPGRLSELLPSIPTWWVPETLSGFTLWLVIAAAGAMAARHGRYLKRLMEV
ncbi:hypothetical protein ACNI65_06280 [Roseateles sp. So40a]|uniref:hypothetical protein n=1 Tax=Roseateles sp. So40a TaxID=3400226 RepID=UPI003A8C1355